MFHLLYTAIGVAVIAFWLYGSHETAVIKIADQNPPTGALIGAGSIDLSHAHIVPCAEDRNSPSVKIGSSGCLVIVTDH